MPTWSRRQKNRADQCIRNRSARSGPKPLARLVNSLFLIPLAYRFEQLGLAGLHSGIGPSSALSIGVAIATYVQAKPAIRINILTARFMVFSLRCEVPGSGTSRLRHYTDRPQTVKRFLRVSPLSWPAAGTQICMSEDKCSNISGIRR